jgi:phosphoribosyl 1,2-cyclic phosphodiesterase
MTMVFCPLFSGSSGNALFVMGGRTKMLIDAGLPGSTIAGALETIGARPDELDAILITHEHSDHIAGAGVMSRKYHIPVYANLPTWNAMRRKMGNIAVRNCREFEDDREFYIGDIGVKPFSIPHDAARPVGYRLFHGRASVSTATDLGYFPQSVLHEIAGSDIVLLESNHDPELLMRNPNYSAFLKQRILSRKGHLSNASCAEALESIIKGGTKHVGLGHLSGENNHPELAYRTACERLTLMGLVPGQDILVDMAYRDRVGNVYTLDERMPR